MGPRPEFPADADSHSLLSQEPPPEGASVPPRCVSWALRPSQAPATHVNARITVNCQLPLTGLQIPRAWLHPVLMKAGAVGRAAGPPPPTSPSNTALRLPLRPPPRGGGPR